MAPECVLQGARRRHAAYDGASQLVVCRAWRTLFTCCVGDVCCAASSGTLSPTQWMRWGFGLVSSGGYGSCVLAVPHAQLRHARSCRARTARLVCAWACWVCRSPSQGLCHARAFPCTPCGHSQIFQHDVPTGVSFASLWSAVEAKVRASGKPVVMTSQLSADASGGRTICFRSLDVDGLPTAMEIFWKVCETGIGCLSGNAVLLPPRPPLPSRVLPSYVFHVPECACVNCCPPGAASASIGAVHREEARVLG
jgi:hypothetical protein